MPKLKQDARDFAGAMVSVIAGNNKSENENLERLLRHVGLAAERAPEGNPE